MAIVHVGSSQERDTGPKIAEEEQISKESKSAIFAENACRQSGQ
jgi:hypothetical protein